MREVPKQKHEDWEEAGGGEETGEVGAEEGWWRA